MWRALSFRFEPKALSELVRGLHVETPRRSVEVRLVVELIDDNLCFKDGLELLDVEQIFPHGAVEPFDERVLGR